MKQQRRQQDPLLLPVHTPLHQKSPPLLFPPSLQSWYPISFLPPTGFLPPFPAFLLPPFSSCLPVARRREALPPPSPLAAPALGHHGRGEDDDSYSKLPGMGEAGGGGENPPAVPPSVRPSALGPSLPPSVGRSAFTTYHRRRGKTPDARQAPCFTCSAAAWPFYLVAPSCSLLAVTTEKRKGKGTASRREGEGVFCEP